MKKFYVFILFLFSFSLAVHAQTVRSNSENPPEVPDFANKNIITTNEVEIFPNPAQEFIKVTIKNSTLKNVEFEMYNIIGNNLDIKYEKINDSIYKIDVEEMKPGYYFIVVEDNIKRFNKSFKFQKK